MSRSYGIFTTYVTVTLLGFRAYYESKLRDRQQSLIDIRAQRCFMERIAQHMELHHSHKIQVLGQNYRHYEWGALGPNCETYGCDDYSSKYSPCSVRSNAIGVSNRLGFEERRLQQLKDDAFLIFRKEPSEPESAWLRSKAQEEIHRMYLLSDCD